MKPMNPPTACPHEADVKALVDGELLDIQRHKIERHLSECADCAALSRDLRQLTLEVRAMSEPVSCPDSVSDRVLSALPELGPHRQPFSGYSLLRWLAAGGLAAVMVAILIPAFTPARESSRFATNPASPIPASDATARPNYEWEGTKMGGGKAAAPPGGMSGGAGLGGPPASAPAAQRPTELPQVADNDEFATGRRNGDVYAEEGRPIVPAVRAATDDVNTYARGNAIEKVLRKVAKTAQLSVEVNERLETLQDRISKTVTADEGYVESLDLSSPPSGKRMSRMALRVPVAKFESTIEALSKLGEVTGKSLGGKDITGTWLEQRKDVRDLRKKEERYAAAYRNARNRTERERAQRQLLNLRPILQSSEEQFAATAKLAALAKIDLTLIEEPQAKIRGDLGRDLQNTTKEASAAFMTALRIPATLLIWLAIFTPLWLPCLIAYRWATRMARHRQSS